MPAPGWRACLGPCTRPGMVICGGLYCPDLFSASARRLPVAVGDGLPRTPEASAAARQPRASCVGVSERPPVVARKSYGSSRQVLLAAAVLMRSNATSALEWSDMGSIVSITWHHSGVGPELRGAHWLGALYRGAVVAVLREPRRRQRPPRVTTRPSSCCVAASLVRPGCRCLSCARPHVAAHDLSASRRSGCKRLSAPTYAHLQ